MALSLVDPPVVIVTPERMRVGDSPMLELELHARRPVRGATASYELLARTGWKGERRVTLRTGPIAIPLPPELPVGLSRVPFLLRLDEVAPTFEMGDLWSELRLLIRVTRPWRRELRRSWFFELGSPAHPAGGEPATATDGPLTMQLDAVDLDTGALRSLGLGLAAAADRPVQVQPRLIGCARVTRGGREVPLWLGPIELAPVQLLWPGAAPVELLVHVPHYLAPSCAADGLVIDWRLELRQFQSGADGAGTCDVPVRVHRAPRAPRRSQAQRPTLPAVWQSPAHRGGRLVLIFAEVAQLRELRLAYDGDPTTRSWMVGCRGGRHGMTVDLMFRQEPDGTAFEARVDGLGLGLGLALSATRLATPEVGMVVRARSSDQARPIVELVRRLLRHGALADGELAATDDWISIRLPPLPIDEPRVDAVYSVLVEFAAQLEATLARLDPPSDVAIDRAAWLTLAGELRGRVRWGDLGIVGAWLGRGVRVKMIWADARGLDRGVRVEVGEVVDGRAVSAARGAADADALSPTLATLVRGWPGAFTQLLVDQGGAAATLRLEPVSDAGPTPIDIATVRELIIALDALLDAQAPGAGPYR